MRWRDSQRQGEQSPGSVSAGWRPQQADSAQQLKCAADQHSAAWPGNIRGHDAHFSIGEEKVCNAAQEKPQKDECHRSAHGQTRVPRNCFHNFFWFFDQVPGMCKVGLKLEFLHCQFRMVNIFKLTRIGEKFALAEVHPHCAGMSNIR